MNLKKLIFNGKTLSVLLIATLVTGYFYYQRSHKATSESTYRTELVDSGDMTQTVSANGTLNPVTLVSVGTQVSGIVKKLYTDFNQPVRKGQVLLELDNQLYAAQVQQSDANV